PRPSPRWRKDAEDRKEGTQTLHPYTFIPISLFPYIPIYLHLYTYIPIYLYTFIPLYLYTYIPSSPQSFNLPPDSYTYPLLLNRSLLSVSNCTSAGGAAGAASSFLFIEFIP